MTRRADRSRLPPVGPVPGVRFPDIHKDGLGNGLALWSAEHRGLPVVTFMLESLIFILVGLQLPYVMRAIDRVPLATLLLEAALISLTVVVVRIVWVMPTAYLFRIFFRWLRRGTDPLPSWRQVLFIAWAGLRGGESLVFALAIPLTTASGARFPAREQIIFAFSQCVPEYRPESLKLPQNHAASERVHYAAA